MHSHRLHSFLPQAFSPLATTKVQVELSTAHLNLPFWSTAISPAAELVAAFNLACPSYDCPNTITFNAQNSQAQAGGKGSRSKLGRGPAGNFVTCSAFILDGMVSKLLFLSDVLWFFIHPQCVGWEAASHSYSSPLPYFFISLSIFLLTIHSAQLGTLSVTFTPSMPFKSGNNLKSFPKELLFAVLQSVALSQYAGNGQQLPSTLIIDIADG